VNGEQGRRRNGPSLKRRRRRLVVELFVALLVTWTLGFVAVKPLRRTLSPASPSMHFWISLLVPVMFNVPMSFVCVSIYAARVRALQRRCFRCGYDLRSGHDRCPECGADLT